LSGNLYLIRHGQAGTREHYDTLSPRGREQSRLLGEYLAAQGLNFEAAFSGGLCRQQETAREVIEAYARADLAFPSLQVEPRWREFDLDHVYRGIAPQLSANDPQFRSEYEAMLEKMTASRGEASAEVHRRWSPCDIKVVDAWVRGTHEYDGESWDEFRSRVSECRSALDDLEGDVIVFTSATPAAIIAGMSLDIHDDRIFRIAGVLYNASVTVMRVRREQLRLFSLNGVAHLTDASLRTHR
jgi:broad specificity phosphatase PhoE